MINSAANIGFMPSVDMSSVAAERNVEETQLNDLVNIHNVNQEEGYGGINFQDPGTPLEAEAQGELFDNEEDSDEDDVQITIGDIKANVSNVPFRSGAAGPGGVVSGVGQKGAGGQGIIHKLRDTCAAAGKLDMDATAEIGGTQIYDLDLASMTEKPWRKPGADITDYFNYGFTEDTWNVYCERQRKLRAEFGAAGANKVLFSRLTLTGGSKEFNAERKASMESPKMITNLAERFGSRRQEPMIIQTSQQQPIFRTVLTKPQTQAPPPQESNVVKVLPTVNLAKQFQQQTPSSDTRSSIPVITSSAAPVEPVQVFSGNAPDHTHQDSQPQPAPVLVTTPAVPTPAIQPIVPQMPLPVPTVVSSSSLNIKTEPLEGPPGVDREPDPPGGSCTPPAPGSDTPEMPVSAPSAIPTINTSFPPPRFGTDTSVPPPHRFSIPPPGYQGPPGVGAPISTRGPPPPTAMPMTNFPPPNFGGNPPPPGVPVGQRAYNSFAPMVRPPPMMTRPTGPRMIRHPMEKRYNYGGFENSGAVNEGERSPASYSDKSSDMDDRDYHERHPRTLRPRREFGARSSHRRGSSPQSYDRKRGHREDSYHGSSRSRHRSASRSRSPPSASTRSRRRAVSTEIKEDKKEKGSSLNYVILLVKLLREGEAENLESVD